MLFLCFSNIQHEQILRFLKKQIHYAYSLDKALENFSCWIWGTSTAALLSKQPSWVITQSNNKLEGQSSWKGGHFICKEEKEEERRR